MSNERLPKKWQTGGRDPERIDPLLEALQTYWHRHPDLRLGQIVGNFASGDPYYFEDDALLAALATDMKE